MKKIWNFLDKPRIALWDLAVLWVFFDLMDTFYG